MAARLSRVLNVRLNLGDGDMTGPHPLAALNKEVGAASILRDKKAASAPLAQAPVAPKAQEPRAFGAMGEPKRDAGGSGARFVPQLRAGAAPRVQAPSAPQTHGLRAFGTFAETKRDAGSAARVQAPFPPKAEEPRAFGTLAEPKSDAGSTLVLRDHDVLADEPDLFPALAPAANADNDSIRVARDDRSVTEDHALQALFQTGIDQNNDARKEAAAKPVWWRRITDADDEPLSIRTIALTMAAVIVVGFAFTAMLPSILTRDPVDNVAAVVTPPSAAAQAEQWVTTEPAPPPAFAQAPAVAIPPPAPAPRVAPAPAAPAPNTTKAAAVAKAAPAPAAVPAPSTTKAAAAIAKAAPVPTVAVQQKQVATTGLRESLIPGNEKGTGRITLTAAERAAVERGVQAMKNTPPVIAPSTPPRATASNRFALTDAEKEAVERGLRELEKTAAPAAP